MLPAGVLLSNAFSTNFLPRVGFDEDLGMLEENKYDGREYLDGFHEEQLRPALGNATPFSTWVQVTAPAEFSINSVGVKTAESVVDGLRTVVWESDHPVRLINIVAGRWNVRKGDGTAIYYHPGHEHNLEQIAEVLDGARRHFSDWFHPYPWQELKLSEFPAMDLYAAAFPTNIVFSEGIGFLTKPDAKVDAVFMVTAHETAHQWWANLLTPAEAPGGVLLSEGMAHFSTLLLSEEMEGQHHRMQMARRFEEAYVGLRIKDAERPLARLDGKRARAIQVVWYNKGGLVFWMMLER